MIDIPKSLERIFLYRLADESQVGKYLKKLTLMGKVDEPKKVDLFILLLESVSKLENRVKILEDRLKSLDVARGKPSEVDKNGSSGKKATPTKGKK